MVYYYYKDQTHANVTHSGADRDTRRTSEQTEQALGRFFLPVEFFADALMLCCAGALANSVRAALVDEFEGVNHVAHAVVIGAPFARAEVVLC